MLKGLRAGRRDRAERKSLKIIIAIKSSKPTSAQALSMCRMHSSSSSSFAISQSNSRKTDACYPHFIQARFDGRRNEINQPRRILDINS